MRQVYAAYTAHTSTAHLFAGCNNSCICQDTDRCCQELSQEQDYKEGAEGVAESNACAQEAGGHKGKYQYCLVCLVPVCQPRPQERGWC